MATKEMTQAAFAEETGMSRQRVSRFVKLGVIPTTSAGKILWPEGLQALIEHLSETAAGRGGTRGVASLTEARTALAVAQREAIELKNRALQDEWVLSKEVEQRWTEVCIAFRNRMLGVVNELPHFLSHLTRHDLEVIDRVIRDALTALADEAEAEEGTT